MKKKTVMIRVEISTHQRLKVLAAQNSLSLLAMTELLVSEREKTRDKAVKK